MSESSQEKFSGISSWLHSKSTATPALADSSQASAILETALVIRSVTLKPALPFITQVRGYTTGIRLPEQHPGNDWVHSCNHPSSERERSRILAPHWSCFRCSELKQSISVHGQSITIITCTLGELVLCLNHSTSSKHLQSLVISIHSEPEQGILPLMLDQMSQHKIPIEINGCNRSRWKGQSYLDIVMIINGSNLRN